MAEVSLHSPAHVLSRVLIARGLGNVETNSTWPVRVGREVNLPDNSITLRNTEGRSFGHTQVDGVRQEHHGVQVRVRGVTEDVAYVKCRAVALALDQDVLDDSVTIDGTAYTVESVMTTSDVINLGKESPQSSRHLFTVNAVAVIRAGGA